MDQGDNWALIDYLYSELSLIFVPVKEMTTRRKMMTVWMMLIGMRWVKAEMTLTLLLLMTFLIIISLVTWLRDYVFTPRLLRHNCVWERRAAGNLRPVHPRKFRYIIVVSTRYLEPDSILPQNSFFAHLIAMRIEFFALLTRIDYFLSDWAGTGQSRPLAVAGIASCQ